MTTKVFYRDAQGLEGVVELRGEPIFIGRAMECAIRTDDGMVSRRHARIYRDVGRWWIEDMGSANGIYVDTTRVSRHCMVHGEAIRCGSLWLRFVDETGASATPFSSVAQPAAPYASPGLQLNVAQMGQAPGMGAPGMGGMPGTGVVPPGGMQMNQMGMGAPIPPLGQQQAPVAFIPASGPAFIPASNALSTGQNAAGGAPASSAEVAELRTQLEKANLEKASLEAELKAVKDGNKDTAKLQRRINQLTSDLRRARGGKADADSPLDKLEKDYAEVQTERDGLLAKVKELENAVQVAGQGAATKAVVGAVNKTRAAEAHTELNDVLSQVRINIRTISDEFDTAMVNFSAESADIMKNAIREAKEQLETARVLLRDIRPE